MWALSLRTVGAAPSMNFGTEFNIMRTLLVIFRTTLAALPLGGILVVLLFLLAESNTRAQAQDPMPLTTRMVTGPAGFELEWNSAGEDQAYTLQARDRLEARPWLPVSLDQPWPIDAVRAGVPLEPGAVSGFYRVLAVSRAERGRVLSSVSLESASVAQINLLLRVGGIPVEARYPVDVVKLIYETIDPWGGKTVASGALVLPVGAPSPLPVVSYQHGTVLAANDVPSADTNLVQRLPGIGFASLGYAVVLPDYLGLGDSPGVHPYHHARSQATVGVDLLRAARDWCAGAGVEWGGELFLCGYSQGGHATMALHRELEAWHEDEFTVTASAPMAGAHDLSGITLDDFLSGRELPNPYYVAYLLVAYQEVYGVFDAWSDWLRAPYDELLPGLIAERADGETINAAMPRDVTGIFRPEVLAALRTDHDHPMRRALQDNDVDEWRPRAAIRLYHCQGDKDVPYGNSLRARDLMLGLGATAVEWIDPLPDPEAGHGECILPAFLAALEWFESLRGVYPPG